MPKIYVRIGDYDINFDEIVAYRHMHFSENSSTNPYDVVFICFQNGHSINIRGSKLQTFEELQEEINNVFDTKNQQS
jgi:hypothetical protein